MGWLLAVLVLVLISGILIRRRHGNVYERVAASFERTTGISMTTALRGLGIATLLLWLIVTLTATEADRTRLKEQVREILDQSFSTGPSK